MGIRGRERRDRFEQEAGEESEGKKGRQRGTNPGGTCVAACVWRGAGRARGDAEAQRMNCWPWEREQGEMGPRMKRG